MVRMNAALKLAQEALLITGFVFVMMLVIEYVNVVTRGAWQSRLAGKQAGQYLLAAVLGATPGCLGAFVVVALYSHGVVTLGAVVTAMLATSGDEAFVLFALVPAQAVVVTTVLAGVGIAAGALTDGVAGRRVTAQRPCAQGFDVHEPEHRPRFVPTDLVRQWRECSPVRGLLSFGLLVFLVGTVLEKTGPSESEWIRVTLIVLSATALFIVATVPDHFLEEHLWRHVAVKHLPRLFLWTLGALVAMQVMVSHSSFDTAVRHGKWLVLVVACLVGLIPESGPHLVFVTLYAKGSIPFSILLASSLVQDGHGMLPLLAHSRRAFLVVKAINFAVGLAVGSAVLSAGW